ncbi:unnamed protein product, partial [Closterium sp. NIES-64]
MAHQRFSRQPWMHSSPSPLCEYAMGYSSPWLFLTQLESTQSTPDGPPEVQQAAVDALKSIAAVNPKLVLLFCSELLQSGQLPQHHKTNLFSVIAASITSLTRQQHSAAVAAAAAAGGYSAAGAAGAGGAPWGTVAAAGGVSAAEGAGVGMGSDGGGGVSDHTMLVQSIKLALAEMQVAGRSGTGSAQDIGSPLNVAVASVITAVAAASTSLALDEVFCVPQPPLHLIADAFGQMAKNRPAVFRAMWPNVLRKIVPQLLSVTETTKHVFADAIAHWCRAFTHGQGMAVVLALQERRSREARGDQEGGAPALLQSAFDLFLQRWLLSSSSPTRLSTAKAMAETTFLLQESYPCPAVDSQGHGGDDVSAAGELPARLSTAKAMAEMAFLLQESYLRSTVLLPTLEFLLALIGHYTSRLSFNAADIRITITGLNTAMRCAMTITEAFPQHASAFAIQRAAHRGVDVRIRQGALVLLRRIVTSMPQVWAGNEEQFCQGAIYIVQSEETMESAQDTSAQDIFALGWVQGRSSLIHPSLGLPSSDPSSPPGVSASPRGGEWGGLRETGEGAGGAAVGSSSGGGVMGGGAGGGGGGSTVGGGGSGAAAGGVSPIEAVLLRPVGEVEVEWSSACASLLGAAVLVPRNTPCDETRKEIVQVTFWVPHLELFVCLPAGRGSTDATSTSASSSGGSGAAREARRRAAGGGGEEDPLYHVCSKGLSILANTVHTMDVLQCLSTIISRKTPSAAPEAGDEPGTGVSASGTGGAEGTTSGYGREGGSNGGDAGGGTVGAAEKVESAEREIRGLSQFKLPPLEELLPRLLVLLGSDKTLTDSPRRMRILQVLEFVRQSTLPSAFESLALDIEHMTHLAERLGRKQSLERRRAVWQDATMKMLKRAIDAVNHADWTARVCDGFAAFYLWPCTDASQHILLHRCMGALVQRAADSVFIQRRVALMFDSAALSDPLDRHALAMGLGTVAAVHLDVVLATLEQVLDSYSVSNLQRYFVKTLGNQSAIFIPKTSSASSASKLALPPLERLFKKETATSAAADFLRDPLMHDDVCAALALTYRYTVAFSEASVVDSRIRTLLDANVLAQLAAMTSFPAKLAVDANVFAPLAAVAALPAKAAVVQSILTLASAALTAPPSALTTPPPPHSREEEVRLQMACVRACTALIQSHPQLTSAVRKSVQVSKHSVVQVRSRHLAVRGGGAYVLGEEEVRLQMACVQACTALIRSHPQLTSAVRKSVQAVTPLLCIDDSPLAGRVKGERGLGRGRGEGGIGTVDVEGGGGGEGREEREGSSTSSSGHNVDSKEEEEQLQIMLSLLRPLLSLLLPPSPPPQPSSHLPSALNPTTLLSSAFPSNTTPPSSTHPNPAAPLQTQAGSKPGSKPSSKPTSKPSSQPGSPGPRARGKSNLGGAAGGGERGGGEEGEGGAGERERETGEAEAASAVEVVASAQQRVLTAYLAVCAQFHLLALGDEGLLGCCKEQVCGFLEASSGGVRYTEMQQAHTPPSRPSLNLGHHVAVVLPFCANVFCTSVNLSFCQSVILPLHQSANFAILPPPIPSSHQVVLLLLTTAVALSSPPEASCVSPDNPPEVSSQSAHSPPASPSSSLPVSTHPATHQLDETTETSSQQEAQPAAAAAGPRASSESPSSHPSSQPTHSSLLAALEAKVSAVSHQVGKLIVGMGWAVLRGSSQGEMVEGSSEEQRAVLFAAAVECVAHVLTADEVAGSAPPSSRRVPSHLLRQPLPLATHQFTSLPFIIPSPCHQVAVLLLAADAFLHITCAGHSPSTTTSTNQGSQAHEDRDRGSVHLQGAAAAECEYVGSVVSRCMEAVLRIISLRGHQVQQQGESEAEEGSVQPAHGSKQPLQQEREDLEQQGRAGRIIERVVAASLGCHYNSARLPAFAASSAVQPLLRVLDHFFPCRPSLSLLEITQHPSLSPQLFHQLVPKLTPGFDPVGASSYSPTICSPSFAVPPFRPRFLQEIARHPSLGPQLFHLLLPKLIPGFDPVGLVEGLHQAAQPQSLEQHGSEQLAAPEGAGAAAAGVLTEGQQDESAASEAAEQAQLGKAVSEAAAAAGGGGAGGGAAAAASLTFDPSATVAAAVVAAASHAGRARRVGSVGSAGKPFIYSSGSKAANRTLGIMLRHPSPNLKQAALPYTIPTVHTLHLLLCALAIDTIASHPEAALSSTGPLSKRINDAITAADGGLWSSDPFLLVYGALRSVAQFFNHHPLIEALETFSPENVIQEGDTSENGRGDTSENGRGGIDMTVGQLSVLCGLVAALVGAMLSAGEPQGDE